MADESESIKPSARRTAKSAALLILMSLLESSPHAKTLARGVKHYAFTRCGELNLCGMLDAQIPVLKNELLAATTYCPDPFSVAGPPPATRSTRIQSTFDKDKMVLDET